MRKAQIAEFILSLFTSRERAASTVGDLIENAAARGVWWFWWDISRTALSLLWSSFRAEPLFMASIGFRGMMLNLSLLLLLLVCTIIFISLSFFIVSLPFVSSSAVISLWVVRFGWVFLLAGGVAAFAVQFQTGRWIARRALEREIAACVAFLVIKEIVMKILGEIMLRGHLLDSVTNYSYGVNPLVPDMHGPLIMISNLISVIALFAGAVWVRRRFINGANALS